ncbi:HNH endonuclease [Herbiconiux sp. CPCC 205763]|uniref:HNH endonuclease n=1 Tax=Herbiconiux aconitum TaxID=2970913 RepID=A0ABT2GSI7_9MICO|nr:HNH endonuclease signature motif containing protein [Herbiconiux aconitum]MCS5719138.1 HNH endonuclease [Herbiconiux aconitum]
MKSLFVTRIEELDARLDAAIDELREIDLQTAALDARRARCLAAAAQIADERAALVSPVGREFSAAREGERTLVAVEIATATLRSERTVARLMNEAEQLVRDYPTTLTALENGRVSALHTRHLVAHACTLPAEARPEFEARLLVEAAVLPAHRFADRARRMRETAHPESIMTRHRQAREERSVWLSPECDGMATLTHHLPAVDAVAIDDLLDKIARAERSDTDPRTHPQRRADALTRLVLTPDNPARPASITPAVLVTIPAATVAGASDEPGDLHGYGPIDADTARQIAATAPTFLRVLTHPVTGEPKMVTRHWGRAAADHLPTNGATPRTTSAGRRTGTAAPLITCATRPTSGTGRHAEGTTLPTTGTGRHTAETHPTADTGRHTDGGTHPTTGAGRHDETGRDRYSAPPELRLVLAAIDQTCRFPGCGHRANRCELDHTRDWAHGGGTTAENLTYLCSRHHHLKHDTGWTVKPDPDRPRHLNWRSPHGRHHHTAPPRAPAD